MKNIELFNFNNNEVRVVTQNGEPWFVANDVAKTLDLGNPRSSLALLDDDERGVQPLDTLALTVVPRRAYPSIPRRRRYPATMV